MTKTFSLPALAPIQWNDAISAPSHGQVYNDAVAKTWKGVPVCETDRNHVPILPNPGFVRVRNFNKPDGPEIDFFSGLPATYTILPAEPWGKRFTRLKLPQGAVVGGPSQFLAKSMFDAVAGDSAFLSSLSAAGVFLGRSYEDSSFDDRFLLDAVPFEANSPTTAFQGGDMIVVICPAISTGDRAYYSGYPTFTANGTFAADAALLAAAAARFRRFRIKLYYSQFNTFVAAVDQDPVMSAMVSGMAGTLAALGVDASFGGVVTDGSITGDFVSDIKSFFGI